MKTLDEVIRVLNESFGDGRYNMVPLECEPELGEEALRYLKEYKRDKQIFAYDVARRNMELAEKNDPLTWSELKQMVGKPVWLEADGRESRWDIVMRVTDTHLLPEISLCLHRYWQGKENGWQAYRKERE